MQGTLLHYRGTSRRGLEVLEALMSVIGTRQYSNATVSILPLLLG